jgi:glucokinase
MLLCGDIGGTKTTLALFARDAARAPERLNTYSSRAAKDLGEIVDAFLAGERVLIDGACFGVPGPVQGPVMRTTNLPWTIDARQLGERLGGVPVFLLNDLEALAWGVARAPEESSAVLNPGRPVSHGTMAVIAAGTGLGEAGLVWTPTGYLPFASEGGHADFGPRTDREVALLRHLRARFDHVSYERVLSGSGMVHLFEFLREGERLPVPAVLATAMAEGDPAGAITEAALAGAAPIASETVAMFVTIYGAEAGNLALKLKATGGVWVGGGIVRKILPLMQDDRFVEAFLAKGRLRGLLADVPVRVILDENTALYGALGYAASRVDASRP